MGRKQGKEESLLVSPGKGFRHGKRASFDPESLDPLLGPVPGFRPVDHHPLFLVKSEVLRDGQAGHQAFLKSAGGQKRDSSGSVRMVILPRHILPGYPDLSRLRPLQPCGQTQKQTLPASFQTCQPDHFSLPDSYVARAQPASPP